MEINPAVPQINDVREPNRWRPPRPLHANHLRRNTIHRWFNFAGWQTTVVPQMTSAIFSTFTHYKTFSVYYDNEVFWVWPDDAVQRMVGDGTIAPPINRNHDSGSSGSSDESDDDNERWEDWVRLSFRRPQHGDDSYASYATTRAHPGVHYRSAQSARLPQLLTDHYFLRAPTHIPGQHGPRPLAPDQGGFRGDLPLLIALIVLSAHPGRLAAAMMTCLRQVYQQHFLPRGDGCISDPRANPISTR